MKQAQAMQQKLADAQSKLAELSVEGTSGGGMVKGTLKGSGELARGDPADDLTEARRADAAPRGAGAPRPGAPRPRRRQAQARPAAGRDDARSRRPAGRDGHPG